MAGALNLFLHSVEIGLLSLILGAVCRLAQPRPVQEGDVAPVKSLGMEWTLHLIGLEGQVMHDITIHRDMRPSEFHYAGRTFIGTSRQHDDGSWLYREKVA